MMRRLLTCPLPLAAVLFLAMQGCHAQDRMPPPPKGPPMDEIAMAVGLKDTQRAPLQKILEQHHAAMMAMHDAMRGKEEALEKQTHDSLARVLTPQQLARFEQWHATHRPPPPGGFGGRGQQGGPGMGMRGGPGMGDPGMGGPGMGGPGMGGPGMRGPGMGGPGMAMRGGPGMGGSGPQGMNGSYGQGRRPPPPPPPRGQGQYGSDMPPPPPGDDDYPPPPPGGQGPNGTKGG